MQDFIEDLLEFCWICKRHYRHEEREHHRHRKVRAFEITQLYKGRHHKMAITGVPNGGTGQFGATTVPAGSVLPTGVIPQWTSSDVTTATVETPNSDATGLTIKVTGLKTGSITLTVAATLPDNSVASGSAVVPILAGEVKAFTIDQIA